MIENLGLNLGLSSILDVHLILHILFWQLTATYNAC